VTQKVVINEVEKMWQEQGVTSRQAGADTRLGLHRFGTRKQQSVEGGGGEKKKRRGKGKKKVLFETPRRTKGGKKYNAPPP